MRAARLHGPKDVRIETVPDPVAGPGQVLVRVRAVSVCPSDWRLWESGDAGDAPLTAPIIQGHEFAGDVAGMAGDVGDLALGTRVAVDPSWHCGTCDMCRRGLQNVCRNVVFPSFPPHDGGLAEYIACPRFAVCPLPDAVSYEQGALVEPLGVAIHAVRLGFPQPTCPAGPILIMGAGLIGLCALQLVRLRGAEDVTVVEPIEGRRRLAQELGAGRVAQSVEQLAEQGFEAERVLECSGYSGAVAQAMPLTAPGGHILVVGIPHPERIEFEANVPRRRELTLTFTRRSRDTLGEAVELVATGAVDLKALPIKRFSLEQTSEAIAATGERPGDMLRAVVDPQA